MYQRHRQLGFVPERRRWEIEILGHFEEFWDYLTMEEKLAQEVSHALIPLLVCISKLTCLLFH